MKERSLFRRESVPASVGQSLNRLRITAFVEMKEEMWISEQRAPLTWYQALEIAKVERDTLAQCG